MYCSAWPLFLSLRLLVRPETVPRAVDEYIFQCWLADGNGLDLSGKGLHEVSHESVSFIALHADLVVQHGRRDPEFLLDAHGQRCWFICFQQNHVAANFAAQFRGSA